MKNFLIAIITLMLSTNILFAQLPPAAQAIYDSCVVNTPGNVNYAITNGVEIIATPDDNSFYLQWFPTSTTPNTMPIIVTLHGSKGNAFNEFKSWHTSAQSHNCGIIALQYNKYTDVYDFINGYFNDDTIYSYIDSALTRISYPSNKALLHGFSLGSARSYAVIYNDILSGNNYFCTTISNAGKIDLTYPLYHDINTIPNVFAGKHWNLFCGPPETITTEDSCEGLNSTQTWLQSKGAIVDLYLKDPELGHNGFQQLTSESYKDTMLNKYLECYNSALGNKVIIYPNPISSEATIQSEELLENATLDIYNLIGQQVKLIQNINGHSVTLNRDNLTSGLYFVMLMQKNQVIAIDKLIITD